MKTKSSAKKRFRVRPGGTVKRGQAFKRHILTKKAWPRLTKTTKNKRHLRGAGFIPKNLDTRVLDGVIQVDAEAAREYARRSACEEGMLVGISSGATLAAIAQKLPELPAGATVLGFNYDTGERYLSIEGFLPASPKQLGSDPNSFITSSDLKLPTRKTASQCVDRFGPDKSFLPCLPVRR
eukprot:gene8419-9998_t